MSIFSNRLRKQILVLAVAGVLGAGCAAQAAVPQLAMVARATALSRGDVVQGTMSLSRPIHVTLSLKLRNKPGLEAFLEHAHQPSTPASRRVMSHAQLETDHLPTAAQAQAVANFLKQAGFKNIRIAANRMLVSADGTAAVASAAFHTSLAQVRTHDGRKAFANNAPIHIPADLQGVVQAVLGLQTVHQAHIMARAATNALSGVSITGHFPVEFAGLYQADGMPPASDVPVGIVSAGDMTQTMTDFATFISAFELAPVATNVICVGDDPSDSNCTAFGDQGGTIEWDLDSQDIVGMSGGVQSLTFYTAPSLNNNDLTTTFAQIVSDNKVPVINVSLGICERFVDAGQGGDGSAQADDDIFSAAAAQGQTFTVSTGDSGSDECGDGQLNSASSPASSPYVVAVGGTTLSTGRRGQYYTETAWNGGGGSPSSFEVAPQWQIDSGVIGNSQARGLPDVSFDADPSSGAKIVFNGAFAQVGGTSLAAPLFAGAWARILESTGMTGSAAFAAPHLYQGLTTSDFHDVVRGSNGQYRATVGWDFTTGFGSINVFNAASQLNAPH